LRQQTAADPEYNKHDSDRRRPEGLSKMAERGEWVDESALTPHTRQRRNAARRRRWETGDKYEANCNRPPNVR
jgi:hypothetical protein